MNSKKLTVSLLAALGILILAQVTLTLIEECVSAQGIGDRYMILVSGTWKDNREPVYILNTREQVINVYAYNGEENRMRLVAVRSYQWDRLVREFNNDPPSVDQIQGSVAR